MKRFGLFVFFLLLVILLAACSQPVAQAAQEPAPTASLPPPDVKTEVVATVEALPSQAVSPQASATELPTSVATVALIEPTATTTELPPAEPSATATPAASVSEASQQSTSDCVDTAAFFDDVTIPDDTSFKQSVDFEKIWRIRNEGTCTWDGYKLVWAGGSVFDAPLSNPIPLVRPGELVDIAVKMRSPNQGGLYTSQWEFENAAGKRFGVNSGGVDLIWARISVTWYPDGSTAPGVSELPAPLGDCTVEQNTAYVGQLLGLINGVREQNGLPDLTLESHLSAAAFAHSSDMACKDFVDHTGSDGSSWTDRVKATGYSYSYATENIYVGDPAFGGDAQGAFDWWMNSKVHRDNILSTKVTQIGIGYAYSATSTYKGNYTLDFARP